MRLSDRLFNLANRILHDREVALDIVQELSLRVLERPHSYRGARNLESYLLRSVLNMALNYRRDTGRRGKQAVSASLPDRMSGPDKIYEQSEQQIELMEALEKLPRRQKEAVMLRFMAGRQISEAADAMGISESSVKVHLARGLQNMRKRLRNKIGKEVV